MAENKSAFKTYNRGVRNQNSDESFKEGQVFTRAPLAQGRTRLLVNYDLISDGEALQNRRGYITTDIALPICDESVKPKLGTDVVITSGRDVVEEDDSKYRLVVASSIPDNPTRIEGTSLLAAKSEMWVINTDTNARKYPVFDEYNINTNAFYSLSLGNLPGEALKNNYFKCYSDPKVHGRTINTQRYIAKPVGCFAFSNDYYSFNEDGDLVRALYQPEDTEKGIHATYYTEVLPPRDVDLSMAINNGFNMLLKNPFTFKDEFITGNIRLEGVAPYDKDGKMVASPRLGESYTLRCYYKIPSGKQYTIVWEYKELGASDTVQLKKETITYTQSSTVTEPGVLVINNFIAPSENISLIVTAYEGTTVSDTTYPAHQISEPMSFKKSTTESSDNKDFVVYDLSKASSMVYWKNRIWLYGLSQDPTVLFASDINKPDYFPYPNNVDIFDDPIIAVAPFNDTLLVFTKREIIQLTLSADGGWTKKTLQGNLNFTDFDANFIQVVKSMVFFKSGDYYYMIVPKTLSLQNELAIAPVSKNINYFLDEFYDNIKNLFEIQYEYLGDLEIVAHYNYLNYEDIHNVYTFKTDSGLLLNFVLLYNTVDRTWRSYTYESQNVYIPLRQDATKQSVLLSGFNTVLFEDVTTGVQFIGVDKTSVSDFYVPNDITIVADVADGGNLKAMFDAQHTFKNWQVLDTGYRDYVLDLNKRYRELQIKFNNVGSATIKFITEFILDGETRIGRYRYDTEHVIDPSSPNFGLISIVRTPVENLEIPGSTMFGIDKQDINAWTLDCSRFPEVAYWKARLKVSGKGYTPRFRLICRSEERYELLGYTWVYRLMYSR